MAVFAHTQWLCCATEVNGNTATELISFSEVGNWFKEHFYILKFQTENGLWKISSLFVSENFLFKQNILSKSKMFQAA